MIDPFYLIRSSIYAPANQMASGIKVFARKYVTLIVPFARHSSRIAKTSHNRENSLASAAAFPSIGHFAIR